MFSNAASAKAEVRNRRWPVIVIAALAPLWILGILDRSTWTPDEPREADIAWRMSVQSDWTLPHLADTPFLEKPPLSYWLSAATVRLFGDSPAAARAPNFLYALAAALAIGALASAMAGSMAGIVAALAAGSAILAYRVTVWLAPDAALLAGCAIALWGAYRGLSSPPGRSKLLGYTIMHLGAALGFMAKSAPGWLVPALAIATMVCWERRWSELRRWELYVGFLAQALIIGPWIYAVTVTPQGNDALVALFWHNVVGRFTKVAGPQALDYTTGHRNSPFKYLIELPVYLLPWTLIAAAAARRAWICARAPGPRAASWRFATAATAPFLVMLSVAATARDIYAAPAIPGIGILIGLWVAELQSGREPTRFDRFALRGSGIVLILLAVSFAAVLAVVAVATRERSLWWSVAGVTAIAAYLALETCRDPARAQVLAALRRLYFGYVAIFILSALALFPSVDRLQDLQSLARRIHLDTRTSPLALLDPDETTIAVLDHGLRTPFVELRTQSQTPQRAAADWFRDQGPQARLLVKLPGRTSGPVSALVSQVHRSADPGDGIAADLAADHIATVTRRYELPEGRRYALLGPGTD